MAVTAIQYQTLPARSEVLQCEQVCIGQVGNVDVVSNAGTVWGRVVGTVDLEPRP